MRLAMSHPTGNANVRQAALAFAQAGVLREFTTCLAWDPSWMVDRLLPQRLRAQVNRRTLPPEVLAVTRTHPLREIVRLAAGGLGLGFERLVGHEHGFCSPDGVYRALDRDFARRLRARPGLDHIYVYEDGALHSLEAARERGIASTYELPIGYWRAHQILLLEERELQPEWAATLTILADSPGKLARKDRELALSDQVIVPSAFVRETLADAAVDPRRVHVLPYGCSTPTIAVRARTQGALRLLFVGGLSQRKGLSYLFAAQARLGRAAELTVIGTAGGPPCPALDRALSGVRYLGSQPNAVVLREMREHDVLVFPTLFDGFGLVMLEAMSQGLVVVATTNSGSREIIEDGRNGYIVPIRDADALVDRLARLDRDRALLHDLANASLATALRCSWDAYRRRLLELVIHAKRASA